ncbi:hypothetical protein ACQUEF_12160 [Vagococcus fluvialis]|jgi:hypothetical protein|nr:hypothetical protein [Vagococcus fluvialis]
MTSKQLVTFSSCCCCMVQKAAYYFAMSIKGCPTILDGIILENN